MTLDEIEEDTQTLSNELIAVLNTSDYTMEVAVLAIAIVVAHVMHGVGKMHGQSIRRDAEEAFATALRTSLNYLAAGSNPALMN